MNYVGYAALSLVAGSSLYYLKKVIDKQREEDKILQPKVDNLITQIRNSLPILRHNAESEFPRSHKDRTIIAVTLPTDNQNSTISIRLKIKNIKTLFFSHPSDGVVFKETCYSPWSLKVISPDSMDRQTSLIVKRAIDVLNNELRIKAEKSISNGFSQERYFKSNAYFDYGTWWNSPTRISFYKADYSNFGQHQHLHQHIYYPSKYNFDEDMRKQKY
jgi:hypothetical protein